MIFRKSRSEPVGCQPFETRAERRRRKRDARRGIVSPQPIPEWRRRLEKGISWLLRKSFYWLLIVAAAFAFHELDRKISDPRINLWGRVVDERGRPIEGAAIEWSTSRDGGLGRLYQGVEFSDERGSFHVYGRRMRGRSLTIHRVSAEGHHGSTNARTYRFYDAPRRVVPDHKGSSTFVLKNRYGR